MMQIPDPYERLAELERQVQMLNQFAASCMEQITVQAENLCAATDNARDIARFCDTLYRQNQELNRRLTTLETRHDFAKN